MSKVLKLLLINSIWLACLTTLAKKNETSKLQPETYPWSQVEKKLRETLEETGKLRIPKIIPGESGMYYPDKDVITVPTHTPLTKNQLRWIMLHEIGHANDPAIINPYSNIDSLKQTIKAQSKSETEQAKALEAEINKKEMLELAKHIPRDPQYKKDKAHAEAGSKIDPEARSIERYADTIASTHLPLSTLLKTSSWFSKEEFKERYPSRSLEYYYATPTQEAWSPHHPSHAKRYDAMLQIAQDLKRNILGAEAIPPKKLSEHEQRFANWQQEQPTANSVHEPSETYEQHQARIAAAKEKYLQPRGLKATS